MARPESAWSRIASTHSIPRYRQNSYLESDDDTVRGSEVEDHTGFHQIPVIPVHSSNRPSPCEPLNPAPLSRSYVPPLSTDYGDVLVDSTPISRFFNGERAERRERESVNDGVVDFNGVGPTERIQFEGLVAANTDDVTVEARSLLNQWMNSPGLGVTDDLTDGILGSGSAAPDLIQRLGRAQARHQARDAINDVAGRRTKITDEVLAPWTERNDDRHDLARERREVMTMQRRSEMMRKIDDKRAKAAEERVRRDAEQEKTRREIERVRIQKDMAERIRKETMDRTTRRVEEHIAVDERRKVAASQRAKDRAEHEEEVRRVVDLKFSQIEAKGKTEREKDEKRKAAREQRAAKADEMFTLQKLKSLKRHFSGWKDLCLCGQYEMAKLQVVWRWRRINESLSRWKAAVRHRVSKREAERVERELKRQQQLIMRAVKHDRLTALNKALLAWQIGSKLSREETETARRHAERAKKMQQLLSKMQNDHNSLDPDDQMASNNVEAPSLSHFTSSHDTAESGIPSLPVAAKQHGYSTTTPSQPVSGRSSPSRMSYSSSRKSQAVRTAKDLQLLAQMEQREVERKHRREALEDLKRQREAEVKQKQMEDEKRKQDAVLEEKRRAVEQKREEKRLAQLAEEQKAAAKVKMASLLAQASRHHSMALLKYRGIFPWKKFIANLQVLKEQADTFTTIQALRLPFKMWLFALEARRRQREDAATRFRDTTLLKLVMQEWKSSVASQQDLLVHAQAMSSKGLLQQFFVCWKEELVAKQNERQRIDEEMQTKADAFVKQCLPRRYFGEWRQGVVKSKEKKWRQYRRTVLLDRAKELLIHSKLSNTSSDAMDVYIP
ncbi:hypothetical protein SmJEL517_g03656 [Synchytrium microbalum]|uniref:Sfi1 spindle body domain-containing protein n=1 Tax=Synchytrium microbalum TaxID=1806994 RepID=A0A507C7I3_9FUNG|nr:uncharacterized protein SmJEL517_g03656 [Synchytrium microbalum]TPX33445.1 hypothetical protein SmJEL517_g03656 [Synchytrium microbalum]